MPTLRLAIVGDTQRVLPIERLAFGRETNDAGRTAIANAILSESCDAIVHLGDLVGAVGSTSDWARFDADYPPSALSARTVHICRGNHDCGGFWMGNPREFNRRYPDCIGQLRHYTLEHLRIILLDTNHDAVSADGWRRQIDTFEQVLGDSESDPAIQHVLVFGHHPPFTNGRWHKPSQPVKDAFVASFLRCRKARIFFAGHVHGYERFSVEGRYFIVSGGGGGPRFAHLHGSRQRRTADIDISDPNPLHYIVLEAAPAAISARVRGLDDQAARWIELDHFEIGARV